MLKSQLSKICELTDPRWVSHNFVISRIDLSTTHPGFKVVPQLKDFDIAIGADKKEYYYDVPNAVAHVAFYSQNIFKVPMYDAVLDWGELRNGVIINTFYKGINLPFLDKHLVFDSSNPPNLQYPNHCQINKIKYPLMVESSGFFWDLEWHQHKTLKLWSDDGKKILLSYDKVTHNLTPNQVLGLIY